MCTEVGDSLNKPIKGIFRRVLGKDLKNVSSLFNELFSGSLQSS